jgi:hypothetical protein
VANDRCQVVAVTSNWWESVIPEDWEPPEIDTSAAHSARVYDYWLGGKTNFAADREVADGVIAVRPTTRRDIRAQREFLRRAVRFLAADAGIRQFLDIGTGIPTEGNTHEVAQSVVPEARVVYVDNDPIVLAHARALLTSGPRGATAYLDADLREPDKILQEATRLLDFTQPVGVILVGILHLIPDSDDPAGIIATLLAATAPGSYLAITHAASDINAAAVAAGARHYNAHVPTAQTRRSHAEVVRLLAGVEILQPGVVQLHRWHPSPEDTVHGDDISGYAAVGRKL